MHPTASLSIPLSAYISVHHPKPPAPPKTASDSPTNHPMKYYRSQSRYHNKAGIIKSSAVGLAWGYLMNSHLRKAHPNKTPNAGLHATEQARKKSPLKKANAGLPMAPSTQTQKVRSKRSCFSLPDSKSSYPASPCAQPKRECKASKFRHYGYRSLLHDRAGVPWTGRRPRNCRVFFWVGIIRMHFLRVPCLQ